jgi:signal transduction histidine kinase
VGERGVGEKKGPSFVTLLEAAFILGVALVVMTIAYLQFYGVLGLDRSGVRPVHFLLPFLVGSFFASLIVFIRRLRNNLAIQNAEIIRLNHELANDLEVADRRLQTVRKELEHGERLRVLGLLGAQVAHDFNNLLHAIAGSASLIQTSDPDGQHLEESDTIIHASQHAAALCERLVSFAKPGQSETVTNLEIAISELEPILRKLTGDSVKLTVEQSLNLPPISADRGQIEMCLLNLVVNARDAMEKGAITLGARENGDSVLITVEDDGRGMDEEMLGKVLDPFFTTKGEGGTGLGLAVVHDAMERIKGRMEIQSSPGQGTLVSLHVPVSQPS